MDSSVSEQGHVGEMVSNEGIVEHIFDKYELDIHFGNFAKHRITESEVEPVLMSYADDVSMLAYSNAPDIDVDLVRHAFERLKAGYDLAAHSARHPETLAQKILRSAGRPAKTPSYVRSLDDRYWDEQFLQDFDNYKSDDERSTAEDFKAYTRDTVRGLSWSYFTITV